MPQAASPRHVVWDFNGTLLDDVPYILAVTRRAFDEVGLPPITDDEYRLHYSRPLTRFFESMVGRPISESEWARLNEVWHRHYAECEPTIPLASGTHDALAEIDRLGWTQSVCSMHPEAQVRERLEAFGIARHFIRIDGMTQTNGGGANKHALLADHLGALGVEPAESVMIGDSLDDADAAWSLGMTAVLVDSGIHHATVLARADVFVAADLPAAIAHMKSGCDTAGRSGKRGPDLTGTCEAPGAR